jgi:hypothetical protein
MKNPTKIAVLRTMLRQVNVEYSALVRSAADASKTARLDELRTQRSALMTRIAELGSSVGDMLLRQTLDSNGRCGGGVFHSERHPLAIQG